ncbi:MAG TPA: DUF1552 domain-containing protein [Tepidisphaeraceae bacterium]|nr:DUF1552 domain-containing protein [Tepidisphaeraceae bacterium]
MTLGETTRPAAVSRRNMLRGAGAALALPFLDSLVRPLGAFAGTAASAAIKPPLRMGIFTVTGGTVIESWKSAQAGPLGKLPSILRSLEFAKDQLTVLTGLSHKGKTENLNGHEHCAFLHLTGAPVAKKVDGKIYAGKSVDQAAAEVVGRQTYLPSLEMGLSTGETKYSFRAADQPMPYEANPRLVFERMFRGRKPIVPNWSRRAASLASSVQQSSKSDSYDRSVLDLVMHDAKDLNRRLAHSDRQKLDEYLTSVRTVEKRIETMENVLRLESLDASNPGPSRLDIPESLQQAGAWSGDFRRLLHQDPEKHAEYINVMAELMVLAFQTDTTRVTTFACGSDEAQFPGVVTVGYERHCHTLEHQGNSFNPADADPISREACRQIHAWYTSLFAQMVKRMQQIDEGGSTLLDNTMLLYTSYMANGGHGSDDYPFLLVGKAGGTLKTGRQIDYNRGLPASNLFVEMLDRMGAKCDGFGDSKTSEHAAYDGRLPGLA